MRSTIRKQCLAASGTYQDLPAAPKPCNAICRGDEKAYSARTGRTLWNHLALLHFDQLVSVVRLSADVLWKSGLTVIRQ